MKKNTKHKNIKQPVGNDFFKRMEEEGWTYIKTVVDVIHEPVLILNKELHVIAANDPFYKTFQVDPKDTEKKLVYELGNGQWNIPSLRKLLEEILPHNTFFKGFEVAHEFPWIGRKIMILNARQIYLKDNTTFPPIILLAIEDMTEMIAVADKLSNHVSSVETKLAKRTEEITTYIARLEKEINKLKVKRRR